MSPRIFAAVVGMALLIGGLGALAGLDSCRRSQGEQAGHNAAVAQGEANAHQSQAQAHDAEVANLQAQLVAKEADLGRLHAERDALLRKLASKPKPGAGSAGDNSSPTEPVGADDSELELLRATVEKDAEVIEAQAEQIATGKEALQVALKSRDEWRATAEARERQAMAQEAATKAWREAVTTSRWKGRIEGFAAGVALGYVGGRR